MGRQGRRMVVLGLAAALVLVPAGTALAQGGVCLVNPAACEPPPPPPPPPPDVPDGMRIDEVMLAHGGRAAQFVEFRASDGETFPDEFAPYRIVVYDHFGGREGTHTIDPETLRKRDTRQALLFATPEASAVLNVTANEPLKVPLPTRGEACFTYDEDEKRVSCIAWGCVANPVGGKGPFMPPPDGSSLQRQGSSDAWEITRPTAKTTNRPGSTGEACPPGQEDQGPPAQQGPSSQFVPPPPEGAAEIEVVARRRLAVKAGRIAIRAECLAGGPDCEGSALLRKRGANGKRLGVASFSIPAGTTKKVKIKLSKRATRKLRRKPKLKAKLIVALEGGTPLKRSVTLRR